MEDSIRANDGAGDPDAFSAAFSDLASYIEDGLRDQFKELQSRNDNAALVSRGAHVSG